MPPYPCLVTQGGSLTLEGKKPTTQKSWVCFLENAFSIQLGEEYSTGEFLPEDHSTISVNKILTKIDQNGVWGCFIFVWTAMPNLIRKLDPKNSNTKPGFFGAGPWLRPDFGPKISNSLEKKNLLDEVTTDLSRSMVATFNKAKIVHLIVPKI